MVTRAHGGRHVDFISTDICTLLTFIVDFKCNLPKNCMSSLRVIVTLLWCCFAEIVQIIFSCGDMQNTPVLKNRTGT